MANPERGEVDITVGDKTYTLKLSMNAAAVLQGKHKKTIGVLLQEAASLDFLAIRGLVWLLLQKYHAKDFKTEEQAGDLIDDAGGVNVFFDALDQLGKVNNADPDPNPEAQRSGTGENFTSTPGVSA